MSRQAFQKIARCIADQNDLYSAKYNFNCRKDRDPKTPAAHERATKTYMNLLAKIEKFYAANLKPVADTLVEATAQERDAFRVSTMNLSNYGMLEGNYKSLPSKHVSISYRYGSSFDIVVFAKSPKAPIECMWKQGGHACSHTTGTMKDMLKALVEWAQDNKSDIPRKIAGPSKNPKLVEVAKCTGIAPFDADVLGKAYTPPTREEDMATAKRTADVQSGRSYPFMCNGY